MGKIRLTFFLLVITITAQAQNKKAIQVLNEAVTLLNSGKFNDAYLKFDEGLSIDASIADLHFGKANAAFNLNLLDTAAAQLKQAIKINGDESQYYGLLGTIYFKQGKTELAIESFEKAIKNNSKSQKKIDLLNIYYNKGSCHLILKEYQNAVDDFTKAIELNSRFTQAYHNRGVCYIRLNMLKEGCTDMEKAVGLGSERSQKYIDENCYVKKEK